MLREWGQNRHWTAATARNGNLPVTETVAELSSRAENLGDSAFPGTDSP